MAFRTQKISQMTPKGANLEATDLIEVSTIESGSYVTRSITGQEIIDAAVGNVDWGDIGGTLSAQTDLQNALDAKVPTSRTLTINGVTQDLSANRTFTISTGITIGSTAIASGTNGRILFDDAGVVSETNGAFWDKVNGRWGIGTSSPAYNLDVNGTARVQTSLEVAGASGITFGGGVSALSYSGSALHIGNSATWTDVRLFAGGVQKYSQTASLTTISNTTINLATATVQLAGVNALTYSGTDIRIGSVAAGFNSLSMYVAGSERARIASTGNLLINTTTDAGFRLDVNGTARVTGAITGADGSSFNGVIFDGGGTRRIRPIANSLDITDSSGNIGFRVSSAGTTISQQFDTVQFVRGLNSMTHTIGATQIMTFTLGGQFVNHLTPFADIVASGYAPSAPSGNNTSLRIYTTNTTSGIYGNIILSHNGTSKTGNILVGTSTNVASAIVNVESTTQGFLPPRMTTTQKNAIASPAAGLMVYDTTLNVISYYNGTMWI